MDYIINILAQLISYYSCALIIYILMSWFPNARSSTIGQFLARICEPYLGAVSTNYSSAWND